MIKEAIMYRLLSAVLISLLLCAFPAIAISASEQEDKGFLSDIEKAVKEEAQQYRESSINKRIRHQET
jgi:hypothetical protein